MEAIIVIVLFYGGLALLGWLFEQIGKWNEERKRKIRDEVAQELLPNTNITSELIEHYKSKLKDIGYNNRQEPSPFWLDVLSDGRKTHKPLVGGKCPSCKEGYLRVIKGQYGKFLGCSSYPKCRYTKSLERALQEYKQRSNEDFMKMFNLAYQ
jgi:hypothetical protein